MIIPLSKRLRVCCSFVQPGDLVADIGCDHGYAGIELLKKGIARFIYAADVHSAPLESAIRNARLFGVADQMEYFLSDGVQDVPRDFDCMICAGMGADTMMSILDAAPWLKNDRYRLILQCQSKTPSLRRYLSDNGWLIRKETVLRDKRFLYTVMEVVYDPQAPRLTVGQCYFSPALRKDSAPELREYYENVTFRLRRAIQGRGDHADPVMVQALKELEEIKW